MGQFIARDFHFVLNLNSKIILKPFGNFKPGNSWDILECSIANSSPPSPICFVFFLCIVSHAQKNTWRTSRLPQANRKNGTLWWWRLQLIERFRPRRVEISSLGFKVSKNHMVYASDSLVSNPQGDSWCWDSWDFSWRESWGGVKETMWISGNM